MSDFQWGSAIAVKPLGSLNNSLARDSLCVGMLDWFAILAVASALEPALPQPDVSFWPWHVIQQSPTPLWSWSQGQPDRPWGPVLAANWVQGQIYKV